MITHEFEKLNKCPSKSQRIQPGEMNVSSLECDLGTFNDMIYKLIKEHKFRVLISNPVHSNLYV